MRLANGTKSIENKTLAALLRAVVFFCALLLTCPIGLISEVHAQQEADDEQYVYDPETGEWVLESEKDPGERVSREQARQDYEEKKVKKLEELRGKEDDLLKQAEEIAGYLDEAAKHLENKEFEQAQEYVAKALNVDDSNEDAQMMLIEITEQQQVYVKEQGVSTIETFESAEKAEEAAEIEKKRVEHVTDYLEKARQYAKKALDEEKATQESGAMLASIDKADETYQKEQEELRRQEEARRQEEEARRKAEEEAITKRKADRIAGYLANAEESLRTGDYDLARSYTRRSLEVDASSQEAKLLMARIDSEETKAEQEKEQRRIAEEEALLRDEEAGRLVAEDAEMVRQAEKIATYLSNGEDSLGASDFDLARSYARRALEVDSANRQAQTLLAKIDQEEKAYGEELRRQGEQEEVRKQEQMAAQAREGEIAGYMESAKETLGTKDFDLARSYAERALEADSSNNDARMLLARIDTEEKTYDQELARKKLEQETKRREEEARKREEEGATKRQADRISGYLASAEESLARDDYDMAREYAKRTLEADYANNEARILLSRIDSEEAAGVKGLERQKSEDEAKSREEAARHQEEEAATKRRAERVSGYLASARDNLTRRDYDMARSYVKRAIEIDPANTEAGFLLSKIDSEETAISTQTAEYKPESSAAALQTTDRQAKAELYLASAEKRIREGRYDLARSYTRKALELDRNNLEAQNMLSRINDAESAKSPDEVVLAKAEAAAPEIIKETDSLQREKDLKGARKKAGDIAGYLEQAKAYAQKALEEDTDNPEIRSLLADIERAERAKREEEERFKKEAEELRIKRQIEEYLRNAQDNLAIKRYGQAREYAKKALMLDKNNIQAREVLAEIDRAEARHREEMQEAVKKEKDITVRENILKAREYLSVMDYENARRHAYNAWMAVPHDKEVAVLIADVDREQMFANRENERKEAEEAVQAALIEAQEGGDPTKDHDEPAGWIDKIKDTFGGKTYDIYAADPADRQYTIDECVSVAKHNSPRLKVSEKELKLAEMRIWEKRRDLLPSLSIKKEMSTGKIFSSNYQRHYKGDKYGVEIKQTVFDGFGSWFELKQTQINLDIVKKEKEKIEDEIIAETEKAYYNMDKSVKALELQDKHRGQVTEFFGIVEAAYNQELLARMEYLKVKGLDAQADFQQVSAREDVSLSEMILVHAMGLEPDEHISIKPLERPEETVIVSLDNCYQLALANNPDFRIKAKTIEYYEYERKIKKAKAWPKIDFDGSFGTSVEKFAPMFVNNVDNVSPGGISGGKPPADITWEAEWYAGLKASIPIWGNTLEYNYVREHWAPTVSSFRGSESATSYFTFKVLDDLAYFSNLEESRVGFERAKYEYIKAKNDLVLQVKEFFFKYRKALLQIGVATAQLEHQKVYVAVLMEKFKFGERDMSTLVDEYVKLTENEFSLIQADTDYYTTLSDLNKAVGVEGYFDPGFKNPAYAEWKEKVQEPALEREQWEETLEKEEKKKETFWDMISSKSSSGGGGRTYLAKARESLDHSDFKRARQYAVKAIETGEEENKGRELLMDIDQAEGLYRAEKKKK